jgi:Ser/Thr protein kinase RdoA (MazF antagonist)
VSSDRPAVPVYGPITAHLDALCGFFGLGDPAPARLTLVGRGAMGRVWRLDTAGVSYAVKELFWAVDPASVRREVGLHRVAVAAGVRAPRPLPGAGGDYLFALDGGASSRYARLYTWATGIPVSLRTGSVAEGIGALLGRIHGLRRPATASPHPWYEVAPGVEVFASLAARGTAAGLSWALSLTCLLPFLEELAPLAFPAPPGELIESHLDVAPSNVLLGPDGLVLLDWDDVGAAHPDRELASTLMRWHVVDDVVDDDAIVETMKGYRAYGGHGTVRTPAAFAMTAASWLNFVEAQARITLEPAHAEHVSFSEAALRQALGQPPVLSAMSRIIEVASRL